MGRCLLLTRRRGGGRPSVTRDLARRVVVAEDPDDGGHPPAWAAIGPSIADRSASASQAAAIRSKLNTPWSSSDRTKRAMRACLSSSVGPTSPTSTRGSGYESAIRRHARRMSWRRPGPSPGDWCATMGPRLRPRRRRPPRPSPSPAPRRCGTRRCRGRTRTGGRLELLATLDRPGPGRPWAGSNRSPSGSAVPPVRGARVQARPPNTESQLLGGSAPPGPSPSRRTGTSHGPTSRDRRPAPRGTTGALPRCGWARCRRSPAAPRAWASSSRQRTSSSVPKRGSIAR